MQLPKQGVIPIRPTRASGLSTFCSVFPHDGSLKQQALLIG